MPLLVDTNPQHYSDDSIAQEFLSARSGPVEPSETTALLLDFDTRTDKNQRIYDTKTTRRNIGRMIKRRVAAALILAEMFERVTFYGIITNLVLFLNSNFQWHLLSSASAVFLFLCLSSFMSAVCGLMGDSRFGRYGTISSGFVVYFLGTVFLVLILAWLDYRRGFDATAPIVPWLVLVLLCIACGQGALKANLSAFGADQLQRVKPSESSKIFFNWFYWLANVGAILLLLGITYVQQMPFWKHGFLAGYGLTVVSLTVAMASFLSCRRYYVINEPRGTGLRHMWLIVKQAWSKRHENIVSRELITKENITTFRASKVSLLNRTTVTFGGTFLESEVNEVRSFGKAILVSATLIPYWMIYSQIFSTFVLQGLYLQSGLEGGFKVPAAWLSLFESVAVLLLVPITQRILYPACTRCRSSSLPLLWRVILGMLFATVAVAMAGFVEFKKADVYANSPVYINQTASIKVYPALKGYYIFWQVPQYALIGLSEVFTGISGLELVYLLSPATQQSLMSALYNLGMSAGNLLAFGIVMIAATYKWFPSSTSDVGIGYLGNQQVAYYFWLLGGIMVFAIFCVLLLACCSNIEMDVALQDNVDQQSLLTGDRAIGSTSRSTGLSSESEFSPAEMPESHMQL